LYNYARKRYPNLDDLNEIHHYETVPVTTRDGIEVLEGGLLVNHDFSYRHPTTGILLTGESIRTAVTNYEYIVSENERKRDIYLLKKQYLSQFITEFEQLVAYDKRKDEYEDIPLTPTSIAGNYIQ
jgi:hypothetical protein